MIKSNSSQVKSLLCLVLGITCLLAFVLSDVQALSKVVVRKVAVKPLVAVKKQVAQLSFKKCESLGDPHMLTYDNRRFDFMGLGDYILSQSTDNEFIVHTRTSKWGAASVNSNVAVKLGSKVFEYDVDADVFYINGVQSPIAVGETKKIGSGSINRVNAQTIIATASNGAKLTMSWYRNQAWKQQLGSVGYISVVIDVPQTLAISAGLCLNVDESKKTATGILHNHFARKLIRTTKLKKETPQRKKVANEVCLKAGLNKKKHPVAWRACIKDTIQSGKVIGGQIGKTIKKVQSAEQKEIKKTIKNKGKKAIKNVKTIIKKEEKKANKLKKAAKKAYKKARKVRAKCARKAYKKVKKIANKARKSAKKVRKEKRLLRKIQRKIKKGSVARKGKNKRRSLKCVRKLKRYQRKAKRAIKKAKKAFKALKSGSKASRKAARKAKRAARRAIRKLRKFAKKAHKHLKKLLKKALKKNKSKKAKYLKKVLKRVKKIAKSKRSLSQKKIERMARRALRQASRLARRAKKAANKANLLKSKKSKKQAKKLANKAKKAFKKVKGPLAAVQTAIKKITKKP